MIFETVRVHYTGQEDGIALREGWSLGECGTCEKDKA